MQTRALLLFVEEDVQRCIYPMTRKVVFSIKNFVKPTKDFEEFMEHINHSFQ